MTKSDHMFAEGTLSAAWGKALLVTLANNSHTLTPLMVSINEFDKEQAPVEDLHLRKTLDVLLTKSRKFTSSESAQKLFPFRYWERHRDQPRDSLYDWYLNRHLARLQGREPANRNGTYFERMIAFSGAHKRNGELTLASTNQLEFIISEWTKERSRPRRPRRSALQVALFDPAKDDTGQPVRGFPCLQQISFTYDDDGGLAVNAYYPTQYIVERAYGNYLGLAHLGRFMAFHMGLTLQRVNCFVGCPEVGQLPAADVRHLADLVRERV